MKKLLCMALSTVMLATSLASCANVKPSSRITSSAGLESYAEYLESRLGENLPDRVYLGLPDETADMTEFENDGYITRANEGDLVIYGKTAEGVDRAVRDYVKNGNPDAYEKTYHEGYRVKKLSINGRDISEFSIVKHPIPEEYLTPEGVAKLALAATELKSYIKKTCGAELEISDDTAKSPAIRLQIGDFEKYGIEAYSVEVTENDLVITGGKYRGCMCGVYDFLEQDMGWRFLCDPVGNPTEYLYEREHIDITSEANRFESFSVKLRTTYGHYTPMSETQWKLKGHPGTPVGVADVACHGLQNGSDYVFEDYNFFESGVQPCFTNEAIIEAICEQAMRLTDIRVSSGLIPGYSITCVDVAQYDSSGFCTCNNCLKMLRREGSHAGAVLQMTNRVAELVREKYPELLVNMLAYYGTDIPPQKTVPLDNVKISYCFYINKTRGGAITCAAHALNEEGCVNNTEDSKNFKGWCDIAKYVDVWYYPFACYYEAIQAPFFTTIYDSISYLRDCGVYGVFVHGLSADLGRLQGLANYLSVRLLSDDTMTEDEFYEYMREWFVINFGDGGDSLYDLAMSHEYASNAKFSCWASFISRSEHMVDEDYIKEHYELQLQLMDEALSLADTSEQEHFAECLTSGYLFMIAGVFYEDMYVNGTAEEREWYTALYERTHRVFTDNGIAIFYELGAGRYDYLPDEIDMSIHPYDWYPNPLSKRN